MDKKEFLRSVEACLPLKFSEDVRRAIACQFALESNFGRSPLATNFNNYCGMHQPLKRPTLSVGAVSSNYASFNSLEDCVNDYLIWLAWNHISSKQFTCTSELFLRAVVDNNYCPTPGYINSIINIKNNYYD